MPTLSAPVLQIPARSFPGQTVGAPSGIVGEFTLSEVLGRYSHLVKAGTVQCAYALLAASSPTIYSTNTLTGGPFLWNPPQTSYDAHLLAMSVSVTTAASTGTAGALGITGGGGQAVIPTALTAIDNIGNMLVGGPASKMTVYRTATPAAAGTFFIPTCNIALTAVTAMFAPTWIDLYGSVIVGPGSWASVSASSTQTNLVARVALLWAELPD
jgi:hypothetical protein